MSRRRTRAQDVDDSLGPEVKHQSISSSSLRTGPDQSCRRSSAALGSFVPDLGRLFEKALLALKNVEIPAIQWVWIRGRCAVIDSKFPYPAGAKIDGLDEMYDDLVDFAGCAQFSYIYTLH